MNSLNSETALEPAKTTPENLSPPMAAVDPKELTIHGDTRIDPYYWLRDRENPAVIAYLEEENAYLRAIMQHTEQLQEEVFKEIKARIKEDDSSVPYRLRGYYYYTRYEVGAAYPLYCRKEGNLDAPETIILNAPVRAEGASYYAVRGLQVSDDNRILAFAEDTVGRRIYTLRFKNLETGEVLADEISDVTGNIAWAADNRTIFYAKQDLETLRSHQIYRHTLGTDPATDTLVFEETDDTFRCYVYRTRSRDYIAINSSQTVSDEARFLHADNPEGEFEIFRPRERDHEYTVDHFKGHFYVQTNYEAENFRLMRATEAGQDIESWEEIIPHRDEVFLEGFELFDAYLVAEERKEGLIQLRVRDWGSGAEHYIDFGESAYTAGLSANPEPDSTVLRYAYTSLTTPQTIYDYDMATRDRTLMKQQPVLGDFSPENYATERLYAPARDGETIPISVVYRKGTPRDGSAPLLLYGYGSYGATIDATFASTRLSLLDRGFVYAIAHIRGGQMKGRRWYEDGKLFKKKNTFTDFIDAADYLIEAKYGDAERMYAMGGSAGGLLMGAVINIRPDLFHGVIAHVAFVDVITTMLDPDIPLTTSEYDEWGNPNEKDAYEYILSYSPYDQIERKDYPHLLATTGLHDSQVQYWEPAKWVAKLRVHKTNDTRLLLKTNMEAGHGGASGRYERYRETALDYAFLIDLAGLAK